MIRRQFCKIASALVSLVAAKPTESNDPMWTIHGVVNGERFDNEELGMVAKTWRDSDPGIITAFYGWTEKGRSIHVRNLSVHGNRFIGEDCDFEVIQHGR